MSGPAIVEIKRKQVVELDQDDSSHMRKVVVYIHRHMAQRPSGDVTDTSWGHDPLKR